MIKKKVPDFEAVCLVLNPFAGAEDAFNKEVNELLKKRTAEGWEFVAVTSAPRNSNSDHHISVHQYIFKRE